MRAIVIREAGGPEVLELREVPTPEPGFGQVRVRSHAVGVNRADLLQRMGVYPAPPGVPKDIPGLEYAGTVDAVGPGVTNRKVGDRVFGLVAGGAYAEAVVVHERETASIPEGLSFADAAAIPEAFVTAHDALVGRGGLAAGDDVLVHAAGSGVGTAAIQIVRALGARAIGTSRTEDKLARAKALGLDVAILTKDGKFAPAVRQATSDRGASVVLDLVGGAYVAESLASLRVLGRLVVVGLTAGRQADLDLGLLLHKRATIVGTVLRARPLEEKIEAAKLLADRIAPLVARGTYRAVIDRSFPLEKAAEAHAYVAADASFGKVLLSC